MEFAGNPSKMSKILASFNSANLGEVTNAGVFGNAEKEAQTVLNNFKAQDAVANMAYKAEASEMSRDFRSEQAGMQRDAARDGAWMDGISSFAGSAFSGGLGGGGGGSSFNSAAASPGGAAGVSGIGGGMSNPFLRT
jgi:hypothetical protein